MESRKHPYDRNGKKDKRSITKKQEAMAAVTGAVTGAIGLGLSTYKTIDAKNQQKKMQDRLNNYNRQELDNAFEEMSVSTKGSDIIREESARATSGLVDAASSAGARGISSSIGKIAAAQTSANRRAAAYLDDQINRKNLMVAQGAMDVQRMYEAREQADLAGLGAGIQAAREDFWTGASGMLTSLDYLGNNVNWGGMFGRERNPATMQSTLTARGHTDGFWSPTQDINPIPGGLITE